MMTATATPEGVVRQLKTKFDKRKYPTGEAVTKAERDALSLYRNEFHGD